jgi:hypothetical protein
VKCKKSEVQAGSLGAPFEMPTALHFPGPCFRLIIYARSFASSALVVVDSLPFDVI